jgi:GH25 family lysozyme M1 (1,4-beta-N-acetylmuramidase)
MVVYGWDASNHDWQRGPMDFAAARSAGVEFFTHKLTDGNRYYKDPYFARAITRARAAGIPLLGAYHVLWNGNVTAQMDWFLAELDAQCPWWRSGPFILQLDCEPFGYNGATPTLATIRQAADYLVKATAGRYRPIIYAPQWVYRNTLDGLGYPLWASAYGTNPVGGFRDTYPGDASSRWAAYSGQIPAVLQYGSQTRIGGQGTCDANVYRGSLAQLVALVGGKTMTLTAQTMAADDTQTFDEEDDMAGGIPPTEIPTTGPGSFTIWPVNTGAAGHGPAWINVGNDTNGQRYGVRVWASKGDKTWFPVANGTDGIVVLDSGQSWGTALPDGTRIVTVSRVPAAAGGQPYAGHLTFAVEYGRRAA